MNYSLDLLNSYPPYFWYFGSYQGLQARIVRDSVRRRCYLCFYTEYIEFFGYTLS